MAGTRLHKPLGLIYVFAIASGAMISSGLFVSPDAPGVVAVFVLAGSPQGLRDVLLLSQRGRQAAT